MTIKMQESNHPTKVGIALIGRGDISIPELRDAWQLSESLGFDSIHMYDHLKSDIPSDEFLNMPEPFITLAALSLFTNRIKFGTMVSPVRRRHPTLAGKMIAQLDYISNGRYMHGMGLSGPGTWANVPELMKHIESVSPEAAEAVRKKSVKEWTAAGYDILKPKQLIEMLKEEITILKGMWTQKQFSHDGKWYQVQDITCEPKPVQSGGPKVFVGAQTGKVVMPKVAAEYADGLSTHNHVDEDCIAMLTNMKKHAEKVGRNFDDLIRIRHLWCVLTDERLSDEKYKEIGARESGMSVTDWDGYIDLIGPRCGVSEDIVEHAKRAVDIGFNYVVVKLMGVASCHNIDLKLLEKFGKECLPEIKNYKAKSLPSE